MTTFSVTTENGAAVNGEEYLTIQEAADIARVSYRTMQRWIRSGVIKGFKSGGIVRIDRKNLNDVLSCREG